MRSDGNPLDSVIDQLLSLRSLITLLALSTLSTYYLQVAARTPGTNIWDAVVPALTETTVVSLVGLSWWTTILIPRIRELDRPEVLIRYGSTAHVIKRYIASSSFNLSAGGVLILLASGLSMLMLRLASDWSAFSRSFPPVEASAFSATALSVYFHSPVIASTVCLLYTGLAYFTLGLLTTTIASIGRVRMATSITIAYLVWGIFSSFTRWPLPAPLDVSQAVSLPWALRNGGVATVLALDVLVVAFCVGLPILARAGFSFKAMTTSRITIVSVVGVLLSVGLYDSYTHVGSSDLIAAFYAGQNSSLAHYLIVALIPLSYGSYFAASVSDRLSGYATYEALRYGSFRRWTLVRLRVAAVEVSIGAITVGAVVYATNAIATKSFVIPNNHLFVGTAGLWAESLSVCSVVMLLVWSSALLQHAWPIVVAVSMTLGYPIVIHLDALNIFAPYSIPDYANSRGSWAATVLTIVCGVAIALIASARASPAKFNPLLEKC